MNVLMLSPTYPLDESDFSAIFVKQLAEYLVKGGVSVTVLTSSDRIDGRQGSVNGVQVHRIRYFWRRWECLFYRPSGGIPQRIRDRSPALLLLPVFLFLYFVATLIRCRRFDVVHCHWLPTAFVAIIPCLLFRKPLVVTLRGSDVHMVQGSWFGRCCQRIPLAVGAHFISVNDDYATYHGGLLPDLQARVTPIPNGIRIVGSVREAYREACIRRLLFVGNLVKAKGIYELTTAFVQARELYPDLKLTLIGDLDAGNTELREWLQTWPDCVEFRDIQPHAAVLRAMGEHDLLVFPSHREGRPNVVMEAAANGLPILATSLPGICEVLTDGETAVLVEPGDAAALTERLLWSIRNPEILLGYAAHACKRVEELGLDWPTCASRHSAYYESCLSGASMRVQE